MKKYLTVPAERTFNSCDNADGNLVVAKGDIITKSAELHYMAIELLGVGTFGQVFRCVSNYGDEVALKVVKSYNKYYQCEMNEVRILKKFRDAGLSKFFPELQDAFIYRNHLCIVLELLGQNLYELIKILRFNGMDFYSIQNIIRQVLEGLCALHGLGITHCDLKPENILVSDFYQEKVKIIDFGSATTRPLSTIYYIQSRFYRAPEVILGIPYSMVIDVWSLGCIAYELLLGHPLFPGKDNADQIYRIYEFCPAGIPAFMLEHGTNSAKYFNKESGMSVPRNNPDKFTFRTMLQRIHYKFGDSVEVQLLVDLLLRMLEPSYLERPSPLSLLSHNFFRIERPPLNAPFHQQRQEILSNVKHLRDETGTSRKLSMFDYDGGVDGVLMPLQRKGSAYNLSENRDNRDL